MAVAARPPPPPPPPVPGTRALGTAIPPTPSVQWEPGRDLTFLLSSAPGIRASAPLTVHLPLTPETVELEMPPRVTVTQSLGGAWIDHFGLGLKTITLRGHTGWHALNGVDDGFAVAGKLYNLYLEYAKRVQASRVPDDVILLLINSIDHWTERVVPLDFRLSRAATKPLLFHYEMPLSGIGTAAKDTFGAAHQGGVVATSSETKRRALLLANHGLITLPPSPFVYIHQGASDPYWNSDHTATKHIASFFPAVVAPLSPAQQTSWGRAALITVKAQNGFGAFSPTNHLAAGTQILITRALALQLLP
ncbi:MAG: hypothetical protein NVSMB65_14370 [Chloroflexota bacterium]